jgi:cobalamin biosynthesis protein CobT
MRRSELHILREVIQQLLPLIAGRGLKVTQQGIQAYVENDRAGKPVRVNIPHLPDDASDDLILAIHGFIDHEVAHVLFTDFKAKSEACGKDQFLHFCWNVIEDTMIERLMAAKFPGSHHNIAQMHGFFLEKLIQPQFDAAAGDRAKTFTPALIVAMRAKSGQAVMREFMDRGDHWSHPKLVEVLGKLPVDFEARLTRATTTQECIALARDLYDAIYRKGDPKEEPPKPPEKSEGKSEKADDTGGSGSAEHKPEDEDVDDVPAEDGDAGEEEDEAGAGDEEEVDAGADEGDEFDGESGAEGASEGVEAGPVEGDEGEAEDAEAKPIYEFPDEPPPEDPFAGEIAEHLAREAADEIKSADYRQFTQDFDEIEPYKIEDRPLTPEQFERFDGATRHMIGPMQKDVERMMAARSVRMNIPGYRSGRLHQGALHKVTMGDDRVFRRRFETKAKATAVTLLVDNSGSMNGSKMDVAMQAAYALGQTLERVSVPCEVIGFTTKDLDYGVIKRMREDEGRLGMHFAHYHMLYMPVFKDFGERMTPEVKQRMAHAAKYQDFLSENLDGESVLAAGRRLLKRPEERKVLIVFSDGMPCARCSAEGWRALGPHLKKAIATLAKARVETLGIGIMDESVRRFYPKHIVLKNIADLPGAVMGEMKRILLS